MPKDGKRKSKKAASSDSDSGPEDRGPEQKKLKLEKDDIESFHIEGMKYVKVRTFKGKVFVDIREYYDAGGEMKPGKKGISLTAVQWRKVASLVGDVDEALKKV